VSAATDEKLAGLIRRLSEQSAAMVELIADITRAGIELEKRLAALESSQESRQEEA
jgi:hypothetical protein